MSLDLFFNLEEELYNPIVDAEIRNRIRLSVAAYAYECMNTLVMTDSEFDKLAYSIDLSINTRRPDLDEWFRDNFHPSTGMWINTHPEKEKLHAIVKRIQSRK